MRNIYLFFSNLVLLVFLIFQLIQAQVQAQTQELDFSVFPLSTEMQIGKIQKFLIDAPQGIYLTVGAERGFRAASMMPNITELWLIDIADDIIKYNQINSELLKTPRRLTYLKLRWEADFNAWQKQKLNLTQADFDWWENHIRALDNLEYALPEYLNKFGKSPECTKKNNGNKKLSKSDTIDLAKIIDYKHGNYLFNDSLYARIHQLALANKIYTEKIDLSNNLDVQKLSSKLNQKKTSLSILDLNNLYLSNYIGEGKYIEIIKQLLPYGQSDSILITMSNYKKLACAKFQFYLGFTFGQVKQWPNDFKMQYFIDSIPEEIVGLIENKLFTSEDKLPVF